MPILRKRTAVELAEYLSWTSAGSLAEKLADLVVLMEIGGHARGRYELIEAVEALIDAQIEHCGCSCHTGRCNCCAAAL